MQAMQVKGSPKPLKAAKRCSSCNHTIPYASSSSSLMKPYHLSHHPPPIFHLVIPHAVLSNSTLIQSTNMRQRSLVEHLLNALTLNLGLEGIESTGEVVLRLDAVDTVGGVEVLDERDLEACSSALAGSDGRRGKEVFPDLSSSLANIQPSSKGNNIGNIMMSHSDPANV